MDVQINDWTEERARLEEQLIDAALKLQKHLGKVGFMLPVEVENLLITLAPLTHEVEEDAEELMEEISEDAAKLYDLKGDKYVEIDVPGHTGNNLDLFVTIGPDESPPDDEAIDDQEIQPTPQQPTDTNSNFRPR